MELEKKKTTTQIQFPHGADFQYSEASPSAGWALSFGAPGVFGNLRDNRKQAALTLSRRGPLRRFPGMHRRPSGSSPGDKDRMESDL